MSYGHGDPADYEPNLCRTCDASFYTPMDAPSDYCSTKCEVGSVRSRGVLGCLCNECTDEGPGLCDNSHCDAEEFSREVLSTGV